MRIISSRRCTHLLMKQAVPPCNRYSLSMSKVFCSILKWSLASIPVANQNSSGGGVSAHLLLYCAVDRRVPYKVLASTKYCVSANGRCNVFMMHQRCCHTPPTQISIAQISACSFFLCSFRTLHKESASTSSKPPLSSNDRESF